MNRRKVLSCFFSNVILRMDLSICWEVIGCNSVVSVASSATDRLTF